MLALLKRAVARLIGADSTAHADVWGQGFAIGVVFGMLLTLLYLAEAGTCLVRALQPYPDGNLLLRAIHDLDIEDQHRALIPGVANIASPVISRWDNDGKLGCYVVGNPTAPSELRVVFPNSSPLPQQELVPTLHRLIDLTASVIEAFRTLALS